MLPASLSDLIARRKDLSPKKLADLLEKIKTFAKQEGYLSEHQIPDTPGKFALKYSNGDWQLYDYLKVIDDKLGILEHGKTEIPRLIVNVPPQHGKSSLMSFWLPIWLLARNPKRRIILVSYEHEYAASWGAKVRDWIRDNGEELGLVLDSSSTARHDWKLTAGGGMQTAGVGGPITGKSADVLIVDDPIKNEEEASSETIREKMWSWFQTAPMTRLQQHSFVVAIGTRWHEDDLLGRLERYSKLDPETGERAGLEWDIVKFKAIAEADDPLGRAPGEPLCPERFTLSKLQEFRRGMTPYHWSALYQQTPTPEEGTAVKRAWWQYYEDVPRTENGDYDFDMMVQSWDLSFKDMKRNDYCVGQVWGEVPLREVPRILRESMAICRYIEGQFPEPNLFGADAWERSQIEMWNRHAELELLWPISQVFRNTHAFWAGKIKQAPEFGEIMREHAGQRFDWLETELARRPYLAGDRFTVADITALCAIDFGKISNIRIHAETHPQLAAWHQRVSERPSAKA